MSPTKRMTKNRRRRLRTVPIERHHASERQAAR
jgi:hypothetical protein